MKKFLFFASAVCLAVPLALPANVSLANSPTAGHTENHTCKGLVCLAGLLQRINGTLRPQGSEQATGFGGGNCNAPGSQGANQTSQAFFRICGYVCCSIPCVPPYCLSSGATAQCRHDFLVSQCTGSEGACEDDPSVGCKSAANPGEAPTNWPDEIALNSCLGPTKCEMNWGARTGTGFTGWGCPANDWHEGCVYNHQEFPLPNCPDEATPPCDQPVP